MLLEGLDKALEAVVLDYACAVDGRSASWFLGSVGLLPLILTFCGTG
jgi:hypothetical protein